MLVFEARRFVELRKKGFWKQFLSPESTGMGIFYTLNVFCIQVTSPFGCKLQPGLFEKPCGHVMGSQKKDLSKPC